MEAGLYMFCFKLYHTLLCLVFANAIRIIDLDDCRAVQCIQRHFDVRPMIPPRGRRRWWESRQTKINLRLRNRLSKTGSTSISGVILAYVSVSAYSVPVNGQRHMKMKGGGGVGGETRDSRRQWWQVGFEPTISSILTKCLNHCSTTQSRMSMRL